MFEKLNIHFLDGQSYFYWSFFIEYPPLEDIDTSKIVKDDLIFAGFCGFQNQSYPPVCGNYELTFSDAYKAYFKSLIEIAKRDRHTIIFCSHFPLDHGVCQFLESNNIYYFYGHTHQNYIKSLSETSAEIADNQIGYGWNSCNEFILKHIKLHGFYNPFSAYKDGTYEIEGSDYNRFCTYSQVQITGTGTIDRYIKNNSKLFMIKRYGYYGFFLVNKEKLCVYICNGGAIKKIPTVKTLQEIEYQFDNMVQSYLKIFSGLRRYQEALSNFVKSFGGSGEIHGLIVDINFSNHIGVNPITGDIDFYYAPIFGVKQSFSDIRMLLEQYAPELLSSYDTSIKDGLAIPMSPADQVTDGLQIVDRGGKSFYGASRYMNKVQKLFSANILRVWDEQIICE